MKNLTKNGNNDKLIFALKNSTVCVNVRSSCIAHFVMTHMLVFSNSMFAFILTCSQG